MKNFIIEKVWDKFSDNAKIKIISVFNTFASTFILTVATTLTLVDNIQWDTAFWSAILVSAGREAFKAVVNTFVSKRLGGRK